MRRNSPILINKSKWPFHTRWTPFVRSSANNDNDNNQDSLIILGGINATEFKQLEYYNPESFSLKQLSFGNQNNENCDLKLINIVAGNRMLTFEIISKKYGQCIVIIQHSPNVGYNVYLRESDKWLFENKLNTNLVSISEEARMLFINNRILIISQNRELLFYDFKNLLNPDLLYRYDISFVMFVFFIICFRIFVFFIFFLLLFVFAFFFFKQLIAQENMDHMVFVY